MINFKVSLIPDPVCIFIFLYICHHSSVPFDIFRIINHQFLLFYIISPAIGMEKFAFILFTLEMKSSNNYNLFYSYNYYCLYVIYILFFIFFSLLYINIFYLLCSIISIISPGVTIKDLSGKCFIFLLQCHTKRNSLFLY